MDNTKHYIGRYLAMGFVALSFGFAMYFTFRKQEYKFHLNQKVKFTDSFYGNCNGIATGVHYSRVYVSGISCSYGAYRANADYIDDNELELSDK